MLQSVEEEVDVVGRIVNVVRNWVLFEYSDAGGYLQRCYIPWEVCPESRRIEVRIPKCEVRRGIPYGFDLANNPSLGKRFPAIRMREIQETLRDEGLWTREDYNRDPKRCAEVLKRHLGLEPTLLSVVAAR